MLDFGCFGKTRYISPGEAYNQVVYRNRRRKHQSDKKRDNRSHLHVYRCNACKLWHVGTSFDFRDKPGMKDDREEFNPYLSEREREIEARRSARKASKGKTKG